MASTGSSQSQASYPPHFIPQKPPIEVINQSIVFSDDEETATKSMIKLAQLMRNSQGIDFQRCLKGLNALFLKGYSCIFMTYTDLMRKMMNHFTKLGKKLEDQSMDNNLQMRMLYVLSLIAELIRDNQKFYFPFTRKFLLTMFRIDNELLEQSPKKNDILAILAVIYQNLSKQGRLVNKYALVGSLKTALLNNYYLIEELFTLRVFNRAIVNLVEKGISFTTAEFHKHRIIETVSNHIEKNQIELFMIQIKMTMLWLNRKNRAQMNQHKIIEE